MRIYILNQSFDYEGEGLLGTYASLQEAITAAEQYRANYPFTRNPDALFIYESILGAAPSLDQDRNIIWRCYGDEPGESCNLAA